MKNKRIQILAIFLFVTVGFTPLHARIKLPSVLGNNMVLQQQSTVKLWGTADNKAKMHVNTSWNQRKYQTQANAIGEWQLEISTPVAGGPYTITITEKEEQIVLKNILIGEVWFCSGQSNMEMPMKGFDRQPLKGTNTIIAKAKCTTPIRVFSTDSKQGISTQQFSKQPQSDCIGEWLENTPVTVANTSAVAYFFAKYIQEVLEVPVGIIISSWGGSRVESWMSREAIKPFAEVDLSKLNDPAIVGDPGMPCVLYNSKIAPLTRFKIKGFLWYQGESNRDNPELYGRLMPAFVSDLRARWSIGDFPFYFVEIAPFAYDGDDGLSSPRLREIQHQHMSEISRSGMVSTQDIGSPIFIHPMDKETVGTRLAWWALADTYGKTGFGYKSPVYKSMEITSHKIYINVENAEQGLCPMWTNLKGFEIAGSDRIFYPAKAEIETSTCRLAVSNEKVPDPFAVRYAYKDYAEVSVFNTYGLPLISFRTDSW